MPFGVVIDVCPHTGTIFDQRHVYLYRLAVLYIVQQFQKRCKESPLRHKVKVPLDGNILVVKGSRQTRLLASTNCIILCLGSRVDEPEAAGMLLRCMLLRSF